MHLSSFDKIVVGVLFAIVVAIAGVVGLGEALGVQIQRTYPADGGEISAAGKIGIQFPQSMQTQSFEDRWSITPAVPGRVLWDGATLWFMPARAFQPGVAYTFRLDPGGLAQDGRRVTRAVTLHFRIRPPEVVYLSTQAEAYELWRIPATGGTPKQLTASGGKVYDYAASRDGEAIAYSVANPKGGKDLWRMDRDGGQDQILVDCGADTCTRPAWTPDGKRMLYHRDVLNPKEAQATSGIWALDPISGQTDFLVSGSAAVWSPDGAFLAVSDDRSGTIRVEDAQARVGIQVQGAAGMEAVWWPDGSKLIYAELQAVGEAPPSAVLSQVDVRSKQAGGFLRGDAGSYEFSLPAIAPDGQQVVVGLRALEGGTNKQLWLMNAAGSQKQAITSDETASNAAYSWDPNGTMVVFQQRETGSSQAAPRILLWDRATGKTRVLAEGSLPAWVP